MLPSTEIPQLSIIVPVYNEPDAVLETISELTLILRQIPLRAEIIVVDDGSIDETAQKLSNSVGFKLLRHSSNRGYGAAIKTGLHSARGLIMVIIDADGTYPADMIPTLISKLENCDMVIGSRTGENVCYPVVRRVPKAFLKLFAEWIVGQRIPDLNSGLRAFHKTDVLRFERLLPDGFSFTTTITLSMLTSGLKLHFEPINYTRRIGKSKFRPFRDTWNFCATILRLGVHFAPLKIFLPIAVFFLFAGLYTLMIDVVVRQDLTERTLLFLMTATQIGLLALLADMISRRF